MIRSQQNVERYRPLVASGAVSKKELDDCGPDVCGQPVPPSMPPAPPSTTRSSRLDWTTIRSPIAGIAGIAQAQVGDLIAPSTLMTTVSQVDPIKVYFPISEQEYLRFAARNPGAAEGTDPERRPSLQLILADGSRLRPDRQGDRDQSRGRGADR